MKIIEAVQWTGDNLKQIQDFAGEKAKTDLSSWMMGEKDLSIITPEGEQSAIVGDWIVKDDEGNFYSCKYEPALPLPVESGWIKELDQKFSHCFFGQNTSFNELLEFIKTKVIK